VPTAAFRSDRAKDVALTAAGYRVLRFTWDIADATILRRLNALLHN
jgi:very-short-patch-repair endonuclease